MQGLTLLSNNFEKKPQVPQDLSFSRRSPLSCSLPHEQHTARKRSSIRTRHGLRTGLTDTTVRGRWHLVPLLPQVQEVRLNNWTLRVSLCYTCSLPALP